jgi:hypothetical protein
MTPLSQKLFEDTRQFIDLSPPCHMKSHMNHYSENVVPKHVASLFVESLSERSLMSKVLFDNLQ